MNSKVLIVMGSDSDLPLMEACMDRLDAFDIAWEATICSAHRSPDRAADLAKNAAQRGFDVIIAAAGLAAHLPGVLAAFTTLPVIGVPRQNGIRFFQIFALGSAPRETYRMRCVLPFMAIAAWVYFINR